MEQTPQVAVRDILKHFRRGISPVSGGFFISIGALLCSNLILIFPPLFYKKFFDALAGGVVPGLSRVLTTIISIILVLHIIGWIFRRVGMFSYNYMQSRVIAKLKQNSFDYLTLHSYSFFTNNFSGSLVQRVNRFSRAFESLTDVFTFNVIPLLITIVSSIIITWFLVPALSLIITLWIIITTVFNIGFSRWKYKYDLVSSEADSKTSGFLSDTITNNNAISLFSGNKFESLNFIEITNDQAKKQRFSWQLSEALDGAQYLFLLFVEFFVFYYAIQYWDRGIITVGTFVLVQTYIIGLANQLSGVSRITRNIYQSLADSKEMVEILEKPYEIADTVNAKRLLVSKGEITFTDVGFNFNETREVIKNLNLTIHPGEKVAVIGPSGAGKTTFVRLIMRLYDVTNGSIAIDGQNIQSVTQDSLREFVSFVPQDPVLFHRTLMDNIRYGRRDATDEEVKEAARLAHCTEFIESLPLQYETFVGERGIKLSGGERQRIAIARAILKRAPILILDEATSSLDSESETLIQDAFDTLMKDCTTIVIAHRLSTIKKMDRIIGMSDGKIVEEGTHEELSKKEGGLYHKLWNLQVSGFIQE